MERVFHGVTPDGRWTVTVDCTLTDGEPTDWVATVTLDGRDVVDRLQTQDSDKLVRWAHRQMAEAMRRSHPGKTDDGASGEKS